MNYYLHSILFIIINCLIFNITWANEVLIKSEEYEQEILDSKAQISKEEQEDLTEFINRGEVLFEEQKISEAIESYNNALLILDKYELNQQKLTVLINMANIEYSSDNPLSAIKHFQQAINISDQIENTEHLGYLFSRLSYLYYNSDLNLSKTYIKLAIKENNIKQHLNSLAENYYNLSIINKQLGLLSEAKDAHKNYLTHKKHLKNNSFFKLSEATQNNEYRLNINVPEHINVITTEYADIQILNKINGFTYVYETRIGAKMHFKNIEIITRSCFKSSPEESPENMLLTEVYEIQKDLAKEPPTNIDEFQENKKDNTDITTEQKSSKIQLFYGWIFSSTPSLNSLEHPIYDISLLNCRVKKI